MQTKTYRCIACLRRRLPRHFRELQINLVPPNQRMCKDCRDEQALDTEHKRDRLLPTYDITRCYKKRKYGTDGYAYEISFSGNMSSISGWRAETDRKRMIKYLTRLCEAYIPSPKAFDATKSDWGHENVEGIAS